MSTFNKQPNEVLDYDVDMAGWFTDLEGDDIQSVDVTVSSQSEAQPRLVIGPMPHPPVVLFGDQPTRFKVWIGGGTEFTNYKVTCSVRTEQDRTKEVEFMIKVRDK